MKDKEAWSPQLEAFKLLKEWSTALVVVQSGAIAVIGALLKESNTVIELPYFGLSLICFVGSILVSAHVVGTIPYNVQRLPELILKQKDIYRMRNYIGIPIWVLAFVQHLLFTGGMLSFVGFLYFRPIQPSANPPLHSDSSPAPRR